MPNNIIMANDRTRIEYAEGARGFPHYVIVAEFSLSGQAWKRRVVAECQSKADADAVIYWINEGLRRASDLEDDATDGVPDLEEALPLTHPQDMGRNPLGV